jgi:hypothetical protein
VGSVIVSPKEFLQAIWGDGPGIAELNFNGHEGHPFTYPESLDSLVDAAMRRNGKSNIYFGVCLRREKWPRKTGRKNSDGSDEVEKRGTSENALSAWCVWADIDFAMPYRKKPCQPKEEALKKIREFPVKPSIGVWSGGGAQLFWLLKEPATGDELKQIPFINVAIARVLGGDSTQDLARVLRLPGTLNAKTSPPTECKIGAWDADRRYSLSDFDILGVDATPAATSATPAENKPSTADSLAVADIVKKIIKEGLPAYVDFLRATIQPEKLQEKDMSRSGADAYAVFQLVTAGVSDTQVYEVYRDPANRIGEKYRERRDGDKYLGLTIRKCKDFVKDHPRATAIAFAIASARKAKTDSEDAKLKILKIRKIEYNPPIWQVTTLIPEAEETHITNCSHTQFMAYSRFRDSFVAQHRKFPPTITQGGWERLANLVEWEIQEIEHEVASVEGEVKAALDEWLSQAKREANEATMQYLPVVDEEAKRVYAKIPAFMQYLNSQKIDAKRRHATQAFKEHGFKRETKRFGKGTAKVWAGEFQNGHVTEEPGNSQPKAAEGGQEALF